MNPEIYKTSRDVFLDIVDTKSFIELDRVSIIYESLIDSLSRPLKIVLLYGEPGTGKSMFLSKVYESLYTHQKVYLYKIPIIQESEFFKALAKDIYDLKNIDKFNFAKFIKIVQNSEPTDASVPLVLLDEAQLYTDFLIEKIRLLSDTRKIKFLIALHRTKKDDLLSKEHFRTRVWEKIKLQNASAKELKIYIQKKLMKANCLNCANMFSQNIVNFIYKFTRGNYRETNKLLYTAFDIYCHYTKNDSKKINSKEISKKIIEMSAIHVGFIDA